MSELTNYIEELKEMYKECNHKALDKIMNEFQESDDKGNFIITERLLNSFELSNLELRTLIIILYKSAEYYDNWREIIINKKNEKIQIETVEDSGFIYPELLIIEKINELLSLHTIIFGEYIVRKYLYDARIIE